MKSLTSLYKHDKPREKLVNKGVSALDDKELMALILGSGARGKDVLKLSRDIIKLFKADFENIDYEKLMNLHGIGDATSCKILASIELSRRYLIKQNNKIKTANDAYQEVKSYANKQQEYFLTLTLDGASHLIEKRVVFIGTLNRTLIHPREIFADAISDRAASIILAHNHPCGTLSSSLADEMITDKIAGVGRMVGIEVKDHLIITKEGYFSFKEKGLI
ncbi:MAG: DNA repair protein RadC [uncultured Campylobacterales bacterium]|uniref:DNA repair protein RadC n=1 Tax=uncultured Campylobacterales bacterium TaxID=352960 RepID=A0A6S6SVD0_9BACT|nr:MAG: DNA repair protein RadC [uncultured Campylobacterales bacterium]